MTSRTDHLRNSRVYTDIYTKNESKSKVYYLGAYDIRLSSLYPSQLLTVFSISVISNLKASLGLMGGSGGYIQDRIRNAETYW